MGVALAQRLTGGGQWVGGKREGVRGRVSQAAKDGRMARRWMCRSSINMYGMLYIKTDSTRFDSTRLDSCRAKTNFEKCQKKTQQNKNKRRGKPCAATGNEQPAQLSWRWNKKRTFAAWQWVGVGRHLSLGMLGLRCGAAIVGCSLSRAPRQTDRQAAAPAATPVPAGVHGSNIAQQNAIKHFVATRRCEQQMLIKGVWLGWACGRFYSLHRHAHTHRYTHTLRDSHIDENCKKKWENLLPHSRWVASARQCPVGFAAAWRGMGHGDVAQDEYCGARLLI